VTVVEALKIIGVTVNGFVTDNEICMRVVRKKLTDLYPGTVSYGDAPHALQLMTSSGIQD